MTVCSRINDSATLGQFLEVVKKALGEAGLKTWRVHDLRHAFILETLLNTKNIEQVRRWTQHSSYKELLEYACVVGLEIEKPLVPW